MCYIKGTVGQSGKSGFRGYKVFECRQHAVDWFNGNVKHLYSTVSETENGWVAVMGKQVHRFTICTVEA